MQKNIITNKITPCCGLPFSVMYWWISNITLNSENDRNFILTQISQNGALGVDGWKTLINSGTLENDASLTKLEFLEWFNCGNQPTCEQLKMIIEGYKMGAWVGDLNEIKFVDVLGSLKVTDTVPTTQGLYILSDVGTYTNLGSLVTTTGKINYAYFDGTTWKLISVNMPKNGSMSLNDAYYTTSVSINTTTNQATLDSGYVLSSERNVNVTPTNPTISISLSNGEYYVFYVNVVTKVFGYSAWGSYQHSDDNFILCRIQKQSSIIKVNVNNVVSLIIDSITYNYDTLTSEFYSLKSTINNNDKSLTRISADLALYQGLITINNTAKTIKVQGGVLNRFGSFSLISKPDFDFSQLGNNNYILLTNPDNANELTVVSYQENISTTKKNEIALLRFNLNNGVVDSVQYSICDYIINNQKYLKYAPQISSNNPIVSKSYVQIGDSISWQFDGKLENFASEGASTGYKAVGGYGQKICKYFGITYENHKSHGLNGRTFCEYVKDITNKPNGDIVYQVPQDGDIYTIFLGTNDFGKAEPLGTKADYLNNTFDVNNYNATKTIYGGLRKLVDYINSTAVSTKDKRIVFITPIGFGAYKGYGSLMTTWEINANGEVVERVNSAGVKMSEIVNAIKFVAEQISAYVIDIYNDGGIVQKQRLNLSGNLDGSSNPIVYQGILGDNLHPTATGQKILGNYICREIDKIITDDNF